MTHKMVHENFKRIFPGLAGQTFQWFQNGKDSIRLRAAFQDDMIFTYTKSKDWRLESVGNWLASNRGVTK